MGISRQLQERQMKLKYKCGVGGGHFGQFSWFFPNMKRYCVSSIITSGNSKIYISWMQQHIISLGEFKAEFVSSLHLVSWNYICLVKCFNRSKRLCFTEVFLSFFYVRWLTQMLPSHAPFKVPKSCSAVGMCRDVQKLIVFICVALLECVFLFLQYTV